MDGTASTKRPPGGRGALPWRWVRRIIVAFLLVGALALGTAGILLAQIDHPWLKGRVTSLVRAATGFEIDYASVRVRLFSGAQVDHLVILNPPEFRPVAPELVRIDRLEVAWTLSSLLAGDPAVDRATLKGLAVAIVEDDRGRTVLDTLPQKGDRARAAPARTSKPPIEFLGGAPPFRSLALSGAEVTFIRSRGDQVLERLALRGLAIAVEVHRDATGWHLDAQAGTPSAPLPLQVIRDGSSTSGGSAELELWLTGQVGPSNAAAAVDLRVRDQTIVPRLPLREALHLEGTAALDATRQQTRISVTQARAVDGSVAAEAELVLSNALNGALLVRQAGGVVDVGRLLRALPAGLVPLAGAGSVTWRVRGLELTPSPRLQESGSVLARAELASFRLTLQDGVAQFGSGRWTLDARPGPDGPLAETSLEVHGLEFESKGSRAQANGLVLKLTVSRGPEGALAGSAHLGMESFRLTGQNPLLAKGIQADGIVSLLRFAPASPFKAKGDVEVKGKVVHLVAGGPSTTETASGLTFRLHAPLPGEGPLAVQAEIPVQNLRVQGPDGRSLLDAPARLEIRLTDAVRDSDRLGASRGTLHAIVALGPSEAVIDATKFADKLDFTLTVNGRRLSLARLVPGEVGAECDELALGLLARGSVEALSSAKPVIHQQTDLQVEGPGLRIIGARRLTLVVQSNGDLSRHRATADVRLLTLQADETWHLALSAELDRLLPSLRFALVADGGPSASLSGSLKLDRTTLVVYGDLDAHVVQLGTLRPLLSRLAAMRGVQLSHLELELAAHGTAAGLVSDVAEDGSFHLAPNPMQAAAVEGTVAFQARGVRWHVSDQVVEVPAGRGQLQLRADGPKRSVEGTLQIDELHVLAGEHKADASGIGTHGSVVLDARTGEADLTLQLSVHSLLQDVAAYPIGDLSGSLTARRTAQGVVRVSDLHLENVAGGTSLSLEGGLDRSFARRRVAFHGQLQQDLAKLWSAPETFQGRGHVGLTFRVESSDPSIFHTQAALRLEDVHARFPRSGFSLESVEGEVPVSADLAVDGQTVTLLRGTDLNPFSMHRFADQHPLLSRTSFLSVGSISSPAFTIAPLAGNLQFDENVASLSQFEMGLRGGRVTGECVLDWDGQRSTLQAHLRATGVLSSHGEPFDGNAALLISANERSIDGRIEILRIGSRHLLDLLDLQDPLRTDPATNRIRYALAFGYPDKVRVQFDHGFASMRVTFGGLASLLSVSDVRGIPTGPLVDRMLAPLSVLKD